MNYLSGTILIHGPTRSGKTTIARILQEAVINQGRLCRIFDDLFDPGCRTTADEVKRAQRENAVVILVGETLAPMDFGITVDRFLCLNT